MILKEQFIIIEFFLLINRIQKLKEFLINVLLYLLGVCDSFFHNLEQDSYWLDDWCLTKYALFFPFYYEGKMEQSICHFIKIKISTLNNKWWNELNSITLWTSNHTKILVADSINMELFDFCSVDNVTLLTLYVVIYHDRKREWNLNLKIGYIKNLKK